MSLQVGTAVAKQGTLTMGVLRVGSMADGSTIELPVLLAVGPKEGPSVWVQACVHGEEFGGAASIIRFMRTLNVNDLRGTLIGIPVANPPSFNARARFSSLDGHNLNRIFPGNDTGSYSQQLAHLLSAQFAEHADYLMDLHSGGIGAEVPFYAIYQDNGNEVTAQAKKLVKRVGCDVLWRVGGDGNLQGTVMDAAMRSGIPAVTIECGGGTLTDQHLADYNTAIQGFLQALDMLPGEPPVQGEYAVVGNGVFIFNREGGLFIPECRVGEILSKGTLIGRLINLHGETVEEIRSPADHSYIAALRLSYWPTHAGDIVAEAVPVESYEGIE